MLRLKKDETCAALVPIDGSKSFEWIVARFVKYVDDDKYLVRDEEYTDPESEQYVVTHDRIAPYPVADAIYEPGEQILALYYDPEDNLWTTTFYEAVILNARRGSRLTIQYKESSTEFEIDSSRVTKIPNAIDPKTLVWEDVKEESMPEELKKEKEDRSVSFFITPEKNEPQGQIDPITDEELKAIANKRPLPERRRAVKGTPIIDCLQNEEIFSKSVPHIASSGRVRQIQTQERETLPSGILEGHESCGRLSFIINEWRSIV